MKTTLLTLLMVLLLVGCSDSPEPLEFNEIVTITVTQENELSGGQVTEEQVGTIFMIFDANGKSFTVNSYADLLDGYAYDQTSQTSYEYEHAEVRASGVWSKAIDPGDYFLAVIVSDTNDGRYSYTSFTIEEGKDTELKKVFAEFGARYSHDSW